MTKSMMAAIGAMVLFMLGAGCAQRNDLSGVSAMVRGDQARPDVSPLRVTVDLGQIITP